MFSGGCFARKQKLRHWDRKRFWLLELSKLKKNSQKLASCVMALKLLYFWKVFLQLLFCFRQVKPFKHFGKKLSSRIKEKRINRDEKNYCYFVAWKCLNWQKFSNSQTVHSRFVCFFFFTVNICIKQKDSVLLTWVCSLMGLNHRGRQNNDKNISDTLACGLCAASSFYHILTTSAIYYWTDTQQNGICLLNIVR